MDRNYWNHICNSLRNKRRPDAPPRANLDGNNSLNMNDFVDIYENRISNIQNVDLENDFHVAVSHMGITPRVYISQHSRHPLKRYYYTLPQGSRKSAVSSALHWFYVRIGLLWDLLYLSVSVRGVLECWREFQSFHFSILYHSNITHTQILCSNTGTTFLFGYVVFERENYINFDTVFVRISNISLKLRE